MNFMCSVSRIVSCTLSSIFVEMFTAVSLYKGQVPAIGFAIIGRQQETVEFMLQVEEFNKSLYGVGMLFTV